MLKKIIPIIPIGLSIIVVILVLSCAVFVKPEPVVPVQPVAENIVNNDVVSPATIPTTTSTTLPFAKDDDISELDTSDWKVYRNEEYGYEIKYPESWEQNREKGKNIFSKTFINSKGWKDGAYFSIEVFNNSTSIPLKEWINLHDPIYPEDSRELHFQKSITVDNNNGIYRKITNSVSGGYQNDAFIQYNNLIYKINMDLRILLPEGKQKEKAFYNILDQMLESLKFTNS